VALVEKEIASLPPQMRKIFELSRNGCLSHQEIAVLLDISPLTVRKQVQNALKLLRTRLGAGLFSLFF
jgi:RNA polymerase sigma-70 factor (ECF subfamily)